MIQYLLPFLLVASVAEAGPKGYWGSYIRHEESSHAILGPSSECEAELKIHNGPSDESRYYEIQVDWNGIVVQLNIDINFGTTIPDEIRINPPPGYFASPSKVVVKETKDATVLICLESQAIS